MQRLRAFVEGHWQLVLLTVVVFLLWQTPVVWPLKILVIFFHEGAHGLAAVLTGGSIEEISVVVEEGGHAVTRGGNLFAILTAGYLGSLLIGLFLLLGSVRTTWDKPLVTLLGLGLAVMAVFYIRDLFPLGFALLTAAVLFGVARYLPVEVNALVLRVIGLTSMIYVPYDIFSDTLARSYLRSDARMLAEAFGGTTMMWGLLWLLISLALIWLGLARGLPARSNLRLRKA